MSPVPDRHLLSLLQRQPGRWGPWGAQPALKDSLLLCVPWGGSGAQCLRLRALGRRLPALSPTLEAAPDFGCMALAAQPGWHQAGRGAGDPCDRSGSLFPGSGELGPSRSSRIRPPPPQSAGFLLPRALRGPGPLCRHGVQVPSLPQGSWPSTRPGGSTLRSPHSRSCSGCGSWDSGSGTGCGSGCVSRGCGCYSSPGWRRDWGCGWNSRCSGRWRRTTRGWAGSRGSGASWRCRDRESSYPLPSHGP